MVVFLCEIDMQFIAIAFQLAVASEYLSCGNSGGPAPALFVKPGTGTEQAPSEGSMEQQPPADNMDDNNQNGNNQV
jgi:hypothetical protein